MQGAALVLALVVIFGGILPGPYRVHGEASPVPLDLPPAEAPFRLGSVTLPDTQAEVTALFTRLPDEVDGKLRRPVSASADGRVVASFGEPDPTFGPPLTLQALTFAEGDCFPRDFTAGRFAAAVVRSSDHGVTAFGRDGDLVWVRAETTAAIADDDPGTPELVRPLHTLAWGAGDSSWLFTASAFESKDLQTLVTVIVMATTDAAVSATPVASPAVHTPRRGQHRVSPPDPGAAAGTAEPYRVRPATLEDLPFIAALDAQTRQGSWPEHVSRCDETNLKQVTGFVPTTISFG